MRIGIDARFYGAVTQGLGRYCEQLVLQVTKRDTHNEYIVFVLKGYAFKNLPQHVKIVECDYRWYGLAEQLLWPFFLYRYQLDLMHFTSFNVPVLYRRRFLVTIHDLILVHYASAHASTLHPWLFAVKRWIYRLVLRSAVTRAVHIIAVSQYTAEDLRHTVHLTTPISVIYLGFELAPQLATPGAQVSDVILPAAPYMLYVGNAYPHKNLEFLIEHFKEWRQKNPRYSLALVGKRDYFYERLEGSLKNPEGIMFLGAVSDAALERLYANASLYIIPSLYEGFGIPPLEAMYFGTPVLASNASCIPEILGDAACYFDPTSTTSFLKALDTVIKNDTVRKRLIQQGHLQVKKYSWKQMGEQVAQLYVKLEK